MAIYLERIFEFLAGKQSTRHQPPCKTIVSGINRSKTKIVGEPGVLPFRGTRALEEYHGRQLAPRRPLEVVAGSNDSLGRANLLFVY